MNFLILLFAASLIVLLATVCAFVFIFVLHSLVLYKLPDPKGNNK